MSNVEKSLTLKISAKILDEEAARKYFEARRWNGDPACGHCGSKNVSECKNHRPMPYRCRNYRKHFSVRTGTVLAESRLPLQKWILAISLMTNTCRSIPVAKISHELGITQKSGWLLAQRIREAWMKDKYETNMKLITQVNK